MKRDKENHHLTLLALTFSECIDEQLREESEEWHPSATSAAELLQAGQQMLQCTALLQKRHLEEGRLLYQQTFKCHWLLHSLETACWINPRKVWAYSGEDYMQRSRKLLRSCLNGRKPMRALDRYMQQYCLAITAETAS
jgi:hypothetical protein